MASLRLCVKHNTTSKTLLIKRKKALPVTHRQCLHTFYRPKGLLSEACADKKGSCESDDGVKFWEYSQNQCITKNVVPGSD